MMKKGLIVCCLIITFLYPCFAQEVITIKNNDDNITVLQDGVFPISMSESVNRALVSDNDLKFSKEDLKIAKDKNFKTLRDIFPSLKYTGTRASGRQTSERSDFGGSENSTQRYKSEIEVEQILFAGGRLVSEYLKSKSNYLKKKLTYEDKQNAVILEAKKQYINLLIAERNLVIQKDLLKKGEKTLTQARKKFDLGLVRELDILEVEKQFQEIRKSWVKAENTAKIAELQVKRILNLNFEEPLSLTTDLSYVKEELDPLGAYLDEALVERTDIQKLHHDIDIAKFNYKIAVAKRFPQIKATGRYQREGQDLFSHVMQSSESQRDWEAGIEVEMLSFGSSITGGREKTVENRHSRAAFENKVELDVLNDLNGEVKIKESRYKYQKLLDTPNDFNKQVEIKVKSAYYKVQETQASVEIAQQKLEIVRKKLAIIEKMMELESAVMTDVIEARIDLAKADAEGTKNVGEYILALSTLRKEIGRRP